MKIIQIQKEVQIPGTDIILEKGDVIELGPEVRKTEAVIPLLSSLRRISRLMNDVIEESQSYSPLDLADAMVQTLSTAIQHTFETTSAPEQASKFLLAYTKRLIMQSRKYLRMEIRPILRKAIQSPVSNLVPDEE